MPGLYLIAVKQVDNKAVSSQLSVFSLKRDFTTEARRGYKDEEKEGRRQKGEKKEKKKKSEPLMSMIK